MKKKVELLVPAGNMEALHQAVHHGADAVYLGGKKFGARKFASNFDHSELKDAIAFCHLYNVKLYVTMNTLIKEKEVEEFLNEIEFLYKAGVDAVIIQDFGMLCLIREMFPDLEVHASTQMHNHNKEGLEILKRLGVKRAVLARELSLEEINQIDVDIEKEVFIHGALCICYSGCCLLSSKIGGRSGNRGECAGSCRLPYELYREDQKVGGEGNYLLSTKELNTSTHLKELLESNITSFKLEGRMKSPEYVGFLTQFYRDLIDQYDQTGKIKVDPKKVEELKLLFHREFTEGHLFGARGKELMNIKSPNHIGIPIGKVIKVTDQKITIALTKDLHQEDGIRFMESEKGMMVNFLYHPNGKLIAQASANQIVEVDNKIGLHTCDVVHKTLSKVQQEQLKNYPKRKIPVQMQVTGKIGKPFQITIQDPTTGVSCEGSIVEAAKNAPLTKERLEEQLSKLGNTPFQLNQIEFDCDREIFIPMQQVNELRRNVVEKLIQEKTKVPKRMGRQKVNLSPIPSKKKFGICALVRTEEQLNTCLTYHFDRIYTSDWNLYQKYKNQKIYYEMPRVQPKQNLSKEERLLITELGGLTQTSTNNVSISDYTMNVGNSYTVYYLQKHKIAIITLSPELTKEEEQALIDSYQNRWKTLPPLEKIIYGRIDLMIMKYCPVGLLECQTKGTCQICQKKKQYTLKDRKGSHYPLRMDAGITHLLSPKEDQIQDIEEGKKMGISYFRLALFDETREQIEKILSRIQEM